jgi:hypothetical protein
MLTLDRSRLILSVKRTPMRTAIVRSAILASALIFSVDPGLAAADQPRWRAATKGELRTVIPARAPVIKENIETEFRTASGVTDGRGAFIAGVVMITAGYSAEGNYSHYLITQVPLDVGDLRLAPGQYVFAYKRASDDTLHINFYQASSGEPVGTANAYRDRKSKLVSSLLITPPVGGRATIQIGRFLLEYRVTE